MDDTDCESDRVAVIDAENDDVAEYDVDTENVVLTERDTVCDVVHVGVRVVLRDTVTLVDRDVDVVIVGVKVCDNVTVAERDAIASYTVTNTSVTGTASYAGSNDDVVCRTTTSRSYAVMLSLVDDSTTVMLAGYAAGSNVIVDGMATRKGSPKMVIETLTGYSGCRVSRMTYDAV